MVIPFTIDQFLSVFERYNRAIGAAPFVAYALGLLALGLAWHGGRRSSRAVLAILALFWIFDGAAYHLLFFRSVSPGVATAFGILFILQGAIFAVAAARREPLTFCARPSPREALALSFALYAMVLYPLVAAATGHAYPRAPLFGVAPCPTTIFTFAILLLAREVVPAPLFAIPFLWSIVGVSAAAQLGIWEDYGLAVAGMATAAIFIVDRRRAATARRMAESAEDAAYEERVEPERRRSRAS